jgi:phosphate transport system substrate-binding protein
LKSQIYFALAFCSSAILLGCHADHGAPSSAIAVVKIDGSSTVFPIAEAAAEDYQLQSKQRVRVTVGISGTGGGFKKLCRGDIDISNASRPILSEEMEACRAAGISYMEIPIAFDAVTVVVNPANNWVKELTIDDLKKIWEPAAQAKVTRWNQVRPEWPDARLMLFGPGADSGTFDYFTEAIVGKPKASRGDYTASEDDNVLVQGVAHNRDALGYFGFAYYTNHKEQMRAVPIVHEQKATLPSIEAVRDGSYQPLSRPLFVYVNAAAANRPEVRQFVEFYLTHGAPLASEAGFVPLPDSAAQLALQHFHEHRLGTVFGGVPEIGVMIEALLARETKL